MIGWIVKKTLAHVSWNTFAAGAATAIVGGTVARPLLVSMVKAGLAVPEAIGDVVGQAKEERAKVRAERAVTTPTSTDLLVEIQQLRAELASVKAELASAKSK